MQKSKTFLYDDLVMNNEELTNVVNTEMAKWNPENIVDLILQIQNDMTEDEQSIFKNAEPIVKITYIAKEAYKYGFMVAAYTWNEANKASFENEKGGAEI